MNYEQKYKEALEKARQFSERPLEEDSSSIVEYIFPELKESGDEKTRKWLIDWAKAVNWSKQFTVTKEQVLAWLEKQGTSYTKRDVDNAFVEGMAFAKDELEKQGEKKPIWSEEDERNLKGIIDEIEANKNTAPDYDLATYDRFLSWLKSIKERVQPQNTWKPSEGQMGVIEAVINNRSFQRRHLDSLYNDLKKLKG